VRLFVAIPVPPDVQARVRELVDELRPLATVRWDRSAGSHVTVKFIGEVAPAALADIEGALASVARPPMRIVVRGTGWFPAARAPRVFWAGVEGPPALAELAGDIDRALAPLGIRRETRAFAPHMTLARVTPGASLDTLRAWLRARPALELGAFEAHDFAIYESRISDGKPLHDVRGRFALR
jgi:RNA 2',3'-cyclic 3'-phosphodiesterase